MPRAMIAMLVRNLALTLLLALIVVTLLEQFNPAPPPLVVDFHRADFPLCVRVKPPPLLHGPAHPYDLRMGAPFNDKGVS